GLKLSFQVNLDELEGALDNKLLNLTLFDLRQAISELPSKEMKMKYIDLIKDKLHLLEDELKKIEKQVKIL
nr:hypothetical protein [Candidatus Sigynarchaeota archaeon]